MPTLPVFKTWLLGTRCALESRCLSARTADHHSETSYWTNPSRVCTFTACGMLLFPLISRHAAIEKVSSQAMVALLLEVGRNACAASPIWSTRSLEEYHWDCGWRHRILQIRAILSGVRLTSSVRKGDQPCTCFKAPFTGCQLTVNGLLANDEKFVEYSLKVRY